MFSTLLVGAVLLISILFVWQKRKRPEGAPPGPVGWPIVGSLFSMGKDPTAYFEKLTKQYGNVFGLYIGPTFNVVINDFETGREAFLKHGDVFSGRFESFTIADIIGEDGSMHGLVLSEGRRWKEQRKFALSKLKEFGMGKISLEKKIKEEISAFLNELKDKEGKTFDPKLFLSNTISNVICSIVFGNRYEYDDKAFIDLMDCIAQDAQNPDITGYIDVFPWLRHLPGFRSRYKKFMKNELHIVDFIRRQVDEHTKTYNPDDTRDLIDAYISQIEQTKNEPDSTFSLSELVWVAVDCFFAGTETTSSTLYWGFLYLLNYPDVLKRVQAEIDDVIGRSRLPSMTDKSKMPFTEATLTEIQRMGNIVPLGVPHATSKEVTFQGYRIPARATVILNLTAILRDPVMFPEPNHFRPERHLDDKGEFVKNEAIIPFSVGRRVCLGEALARMELFLYFTSILQNFDIQLPTDAPKPSMEPHLGFLVAAAEPYKIQINVR